MATKVYRTANRTNEVEAERGDIDGLPYHVTSWYRDGKNSPFAAQATVARYDDGSFWEIGEAVCDDRHEAEARAVWAAYHAVTKRYPAQEPPKFRVGWGG